ncbi:MAG: G8 domain-containing protein [Rubrivivax sp.]
MTVISWATRLQCAARLSALFVWLSAVGLGLASCGGGDSDAPEAASAAATSAPLNAHDTHGHPQSKPLNGALNGILVDAAEEALGELCRGDETEGADGALVAVQAASTARKASTPAIATGLTAPASVCFFENTQYTGRSTCASIGAGDIPVALDNRISSVQVPPGLRLELFDQAAQSGASAVLTANAPNLGTLAFNDRTSAFRITATVTPPPVADTFYWSNPATWGGSKPVAGAAVHVPAGMKLVLDESTPSLGVLTIEGELSVRPGAKVDLITAAIVVRGSTGVLRAGAEGQRFTGKLAITLTDTYRAGDVTGLRMGTRGIIVYDGGKLLLFGSPPALSWTRLAAHAPAQAKSLSLSQVTGWAAGQKVAIAPTEWYPVFPWALQAQHDASVGTELRTLSGVRVQTANLTTALSQFKWGSLQYMTDNGLSLSPGPFNAPHPDAARVIDERAEVGNLTRNIVVQGLNDLRWKQDGFGAHIMVMDLASRVQLDGVELRQMGQAGIEGRYPLHWHMLSYGPSGQLLGDAVGHFVRNSSIWNSRQRCIVIHGTNGVTVSNNVCYDIKGHGIFLEDGVERRNVIEGNLVLRVRSPQSAHLITRHEEGGAASGCGGGAAGFWLTNPDNTVRHNAVADAQGNGFWLSYPATPKKQNAHVPIRPVNLPHAPFEHNTARANGFYGVALECAMVDDAGNTGLIQYAPTVDGSPFDFSNGQRFTLRGITMAKNMMGGYLNRATYPDYRQFVLAGNLQRSITGVVLQGSTKHALVVANSLNQQQPPPACCLEPQLAIASYHSQMDISENTFSGFANRGYARTSNGWDLSSGTFGTDDYYVKPVEKGFARNVNNRLIGSDPGWRALPPHMQPNYTVASRNSWTLAGALWDPYGHVAGANRWWVLDSPFLSDASCQPVPSSVPAGTVANGLSCAGPYYGVVDFWLNRDGPHATDRFGLLEKLVVKRYTPSGQWVADWVVEQGYDSRFLGHMRHFAALKQARYELTLPQYPQAATVKQAPRWLQFHVENLLNSGDELLLAVPFDGTRTPTRVMASTNPDFARLSPPGQDSRLLTPVASLAALSQGPGHQYWQDSARQRIWLKLVPLGLEAPFAGAEALSDTALYRRYAVRIE